MVLRWLGYGFEKTPLVWRTSRLQRERVTSAGTTPAVDEVGLVDDAELTHRVPAGRLMLPGWHMLELAVTHERASLMVCMSLDTGSGFVDGLRIQLPVRQGRVAKRLFFVPKRLRAIRFDKIEGGAGLTVTHLRIAWLTPWFAQDRLVRRLVSVHHLWRDRAHGEVRAALKREAREQGVKWRSLALAHYEATFERRSGQRNYTKWLETRRELSPDHVAKVIGMLPRHPKISLLLSVESVGVEWLRGCLDSVLGQLYGDWELFGLADAARAPDAWGLLQAYAARDARIRLVAGAALCEAFDRVSGEFVTLIGADDALSPHALFHVIEALHRHPDAGLLYGDEDRIDGRGVRRDPHFKPQWNPDLLLAQNYIGRLAVFRTELLRVLGGFDVEAGQVWTEHELALRVTSRLSAAQIVHIPFVMYHRRIEAEQAAAKQGEDRQTSPGQLTVVGAHVRAQVPEAEVMTGTLPHTCRVRWPLPRRLPLVSLLIPTRDRVEILKPCVDVILERSGYPKLEVLILDNQSVCAETLAYMREVSARDERVRVLRWDRPFNYAAINNFGALYAKGEILGLVNNDIEPINADWLDEMVRHACRPEIGCVGAKLYYPNDTIQHAGVILGIGGVAGHAHKHFNRKSPGYCGRLQVTHNVSAVTGACMLLRRSVFEEVGGLNEKSLAVTYNDVDLCLKVRQAGYRNVWTPYAELYHHESMSRGTADTSAKRGRAKAEAAYMRRTWGRLLDHDPAYNPNLTLVHEDFSLR